MSETWWTAERVEQLRSLYAKGMSNRQIASLMGAVSRSVIINKVRRLGLNDGTARVEQAAKTAVVAQDRRNSGIGAQVQKINRGPTEIPCETVALKQANVMSRRVPIIDLAAFECRYPDPEGDPANAISHTFCGHAVLMGKSYCAAHAALIRGLGTPAERWAIPAKLLRERVA